MDNKDTNRAGRPFEQKFIMVYPCGYKTVDRATSRFDNETNRQEQPLLTRDFRKKRHGQ